MGAGRLANWALNGATGVLVVCAVVVTALRVRDAIRPPDAVASPTQTPRRLPTHRVVDWRSYTAGGERTGPTTALVTIVEFADFQCPFCRRAAPALRAIERHYPQEVSVIYRHYPGHEFSVAAAIAAECAARSARFEAVHDLLYAQAESIGKKPWARFAAEAGVSDTVAFSGCVRHRSTIDAIARDTLAATALGVNGTPTFLINDLAVVGYNEQQLTGYVDAAVARARIGN